MKVQAKWNHVFAVTREVEVDEADFQQWAADRYGEKYDRELAIAAWIEQQDTEFIAEVFSDWRTNEPLPSDFELLYSDVMDVTADREDGSEP